MAITVSSMTFLGTMNVDAELSVAEGITRKIFQANAQDGKREKEAFHADYLQGLDEENDYIIVNSSVGGYAIFEREGMELIEYSDTNASPYGQESEEIYYAGPTNYYQKENETFKHLYTGEKFEKTQMHEVAKAVKEKIKGNRKQRKG